MNQPKRSIFENLLNSVEAIIWEADFKTSALTFVSRHVVTMLGYSLEKWMDDPSLFARICHPDDLPKVQRAKDAVTPENNHYEVIYRMRHADGHLLWLSDRVVVEFNGDQPKVMRGVSYDVSERRQIEEALALVVEVIAQASTLDSIDDISLHCLSRICQLADWQVGQAWFPQEGQLVCSAEAFYSSIAAGSFRQESLQNVLAIGQGLPGQAAHENTAVFTGTSREKRCQSLQVIKSGFAFPVSNGGKLLAVFEFLSTRKRDPDKFFLNAIEEIGTHLAVVFERRKAQDMLVLQRAREQVILDSMPSMVWYKDLNNRVVSVNKAVCDTLGVKASDLEGQDLAELYPDESAEYFEADLEVIKSGKPKLGIVETIRRVDGTIRWLHTDKMPYLDENGEIKGVICFCSDVTDLKSAEDELLAAQADLEHKVAERTKELNEANIYFNLSHDLFCIATVDGYFRRVNSAWSDKLGYSLEELVSKPYDNFVHPDDRLSTVQKNALIMKGESVYNFENRYICKDGSICWLLWSATPVLDGLIYAVAYDITDRKAAEQELLDINIALKNAVEGIAKVDTESRFISVNQSFASLHGYQAAELVGQRTEELVYPEDFTQWRTCYESMLRDGKAEIELLGLRKDGDLFHQSVTMVRVTDAKDNFTCYYIFNKDISPRKQVEASLQQSEARFNQLASHVPGGIYQYLHRRDGSHQFPYVSASCRNILELEPEAIMANGDLVFSRIHPDDLPSMMAHTLEACIGPSVFEWEGRLCSESGHIKWIRCSSHPEVLENGDLLFNGLVTDITSQKLADEEIRKLNLDLRERVDKLATVNQELENLTRKLEFAYDSALEASKLKSEFVANISHEIRTPISAVIGMSELLLDTVLNEEQKQFTTMVRDSARSLLTIINDILDFSKVEAGRVEFDIVDFNVLSLLEDCADLLAPSARKKRLVLLTWVDPRLPVTLRGDPVRLRQVLLNLASNAVKFTRHGEVIIRAELEENTVKFSVVDTGIGLSLSARKRLFNPFVQADGSTTRKYGGTGLGLSISKLLVEMMQGQIDFVSEVGKGSAFWFTVPLSPSIESITLEEVIAPRAQVLDGGGDFTDGENELVFSADKRVLLVSRSQSMIDILNSYLAIYSLNLTVVRSLNQIVPELGQSGQGPLQLIIYDMEIGQELTSDKRADQTDSGAQKNYSGSFSLAPTAAEIESFQSLCIAVSTALEPALPGLIVVGASELPDNPLSAAGQSYIGRLQKPFRLFDILNEVEKGFNGAIQLTDSIAAVEVTSPAPVPLRRFSGQRILIAEDNAVMQELALRQVQRLGMVADVVSNGREALQASRTGYYALVLMDCQMPEMDGYEATLSIRKEEAARGGHVPIIAMTASAMKGDRENCIAAGMDDYLSKPVGQEQLSRLLEKWLPNESIAIEKFEAAPLANPDIPIDCDVLATLYGVTDLKRLINSFSTECEELLRDTKLAVSSRNDSEIIRLAHQLKGLAVVMTAESLSRAALALETAAKRGDSANLAILTEALEAELAAVLDYIESRKSSPIFS